MRSILPLALLALVLVACQSNSKPSPDAPTSSSAQGMTSSTGPTSPIDSLATQKHPSGPPAPPVPMPATATKLAKSSNAFGYDLYGKVGPGNVAISPASISIALAMTLEGAKADTAAQMKKTMHLDGDSAGDWGKLSSALQDPSRGVEIRIANRLFAEKTYKLEEPFVQKVQNDFGAPVSGLDFKNHKDESRAKINGWVADQTEQHIKDLVPENGVTPDTRLALVNAIYFLGSWEEPFETSRTSNADFTLAPGKTKQVPMMKHTAHFRSGSAAGAKIVELPYKNNTMSMTVIVPDKVDGLAAIEKTLSTDTIDKFDKAISTQNTDVALPRFTIDPATSFSLGEALVGLGMKNAFDRDHADFTAMANPPAPADRLYIAKVFHKAFVKVDEKGTEAAAATAVTMAKAGAAPEAPFEVTADRPFLFLIRDKSTGLVLFMGRVAEPKS